MSIRPKDPLLLSGKVLCLFMQAAMAIGTVALIAALGATAFYTPELARQAGMEPFPPGFPKAILAGVMAIGLGIVAALFVFFLRLRQIIATVGEGDPFQPSNADRLSQMAWLMVGTQVLVLFAIPLGVRLAAFADEIEAHETGFDNGLDLTGILLVVILFILARVFRRGAEMREDLEGTI